MPGLFVVWVSIPHVWVVSMQIAMNRHSTLGLGIVEASKSV